MTASSRSASPIPRFRRTGNICWSSTPPISGRRSTTPIRPWRWWMWPCARKSTKSIRRCWTASSRPWRRRAAWRTAASRPAWHMSIIRAYLTRSISRWKSSMGGRPTGSSSGRLPILRNCTDGEPWRTECALWWSMTGRPTMQGQCLPTTKQTAISRCWTRTQSPLWSRGPGGFWGYMTMRPLPVWTSSTSGGKRRASATG